MTNFFNTVEATGQLLFECDAKNGLQNEIILSFFKNNRKQSFTPWEVHDFLHTLGYNYPITSVRRAITTLTANGDLVRHKKAKQKTGNLGAPNYVWQFNNKKNEQTVA